MNKIYAISHYADKYQMILNIIRTGIDNQFNTGSYIYSHQYYGKSKNRRRRMLELYLGWLRRFDQREER